MDPNIPVQPTQPVTQPIAPSVPEQPSQPKPKLSKWIITLVVVLILLIVGGVSAYVLNKNPIMKTLPSPTPMVKVSPTPTSTPDLTANWKTYTRTYVDYGYSMKYPSDFSLNPPGSQVGTGAVDYIGDSKTSITTYLSGKSLQNNQIAISMLALAENISDMQALANRVGGDKKDSNGNSIENLPFQSVTIGGIKSIKVTNANIVNYAIPTSGGFIWISAQPANSTQIPIFETMISTFKFTTQISQTANDPTKVVNDFYSAYVDCQQKWDTANLKGTGPASPNTCSSFSTYPVFSSDLISKLNQVKGADPILCAQNIPASIKVDTANTNGNTSSVTVHTYYLSSGDNPIQVGLTLKNNNWLITSITCTN
jgi:hypothetical protein